MAWYIAIHDHDNPVSQHGLASYVTKFESQSFRLRSKVGVAFAQQESCWRSQQSASVKVKGQGEGQTLAFFLELVSTLLCCAYASYFTENKLTHITLRNSRTAAVKSLHPSMCIAVHCSILLHPQLPWYHESAHYWELRDQVERNSFRVQLSARGIATCFASAQPSQSQKVK